MSGSGRETLQDVREWPGGPHGWSGGPSGCVRMVEMALTGGREALSDVRDWSRGLSGGREAHPDVRERSGGPPGCPILVGRLFRMSGSDRETLSNDWEWSGAPPG